MILVEGILIFADKRLREQMDVKIYVDTDADLRLLRRLQRDIEERGRTLESVMNQYLSTVRPMHLEFVEPSKRYADVIIPEGGFNEVAIEMVASRLRALIGEERLRPMREPVRKTMTQPAPAGAGGDQPPEASATRCRDRLRLLGQEPGPQLQAARQPGPGGRCDGGRPADRGRACARHSRGRGTAGRPWLRCRRASSSARPAETHFELVRAALHAGKDVFVEKPLALRAEEGAELVRLAETNGRILMVGHVLEYHPAIVRLRELVRAGELGKVQYIYSNRLSLGKVRREENILWSFAPHDVAIILRLMGSMPLQVVATGGAYVQPNIADVTVTNLLFDNGVRAHIHVSWLHPFKEQRLVVIGSRKMASFDDVAKQLVLYDQRVEVEKGQPVPIKGEGEQVEFAKDEPLRLECQAFLRRDRHPHAAADRRPERTARAAGARRGTALADAQWRTGDADASRI